MKRFFAHLFIACAVLVFSGCAHQFGNEKLVPESDASVAEKIQKGKTTKAQIRKDWGAPMSSDTNADGGESWDYIFSKVKYVPFASLIGKSPEAEVSKLTVIFDNKGIVSNYSFTGGSGN